MPRKQETEETTFTPLPRELWREIEGGCCCYVCTGEVFARKSVPAYWDTLASCGGKTWPVHCPELHQRPKA